MKLNAFLLILSILLVAYSQYAYAQKTFIGEQKIYYGASYYPESWPAEAIDQDIIKMKELHMNVMRMAEFSWSSMEPSEGNYTFEWLHAVIEKLHKNGISTILGTPTATPPAWLLEKHPEILRTNDDGTHQQHGGRKDYNYSSPVYREKMSVFVERMAKEFGKKPGVIGWQIDNEFSITPDYSTVTRQAWHNWLKNKYGTIDQLNKRWDNVLWSQTYNAFTQIPMPAKEVWHSPSLRWNWMMFSSDEVVAFQNIQVAIIRKYSSLPITHDGTPSNTLQYEKLFANLDFMAVNNYHSFEAYLNVLSNHDRMRGYGKGYHWLFETAPNNSGGGPEGKTWHIHQPVGSVKAALWMNFALGGQGAMYWLWRQHWGAHEMVHGAVLSSWNKPAANYKELKSLGEELHKVSNFLMRTPVAPAQLAIVFSHESLVAFSIEQYVNDIKYYNEWSNRFYIPIQQTQLHRDVIGYTSDLSKYKVIFMPLCPYVPKSFRAALKTWVEKGGTLIMGPMTGYRTEDFTSFQDHATGDFETWIGTEVESRVPIGLQRRPAEEPYNLQWASGNSIKPVEASLWTEALRPESGKIVATYQGGVQNGLPAIVETKVKSGKVVYLGTDPGKDALATLVLQYSNEAGIKPIVENGSGILAVPRKGQTTKGLVLVNLTKESKEIKVSEGGTDLLSGSKEETIIKLSPFQTKVLELK